MTTARKHLPASFLVGAGEEPDAAEPRRAAVREDAATTALGVAFRARADMTVAEVAERLRNEVEAGLDVIAAESPGLVSLGGKALRDKLELAAWRVAAQATRKEAVE